MKLFKDIDNDGIVDIATHHRRGYLVENLAQFKDFTSKDMVLVQKLDSTLESQKKCNV